jgi:hypothetical protein
MRSRLLTLMSRSRLDTVNWDESSVIGACLYD